MEQKRTFDCIKAYDVRGVCQTRWTQRSPRVLPGPWWKCWTQRIVSLDGMYALIVPMLVDALTKALTQQGVDVMQLGLAGTEEVYYWAGEHQLDLGLMVTASHNPAEYNGIKIVRRGASP